MKKQPEMTEDEAERMKQNVMCNICSLINREVGLRAGYEDDRFDELFHEIEQLHTNAVDNLNSYKKDKLHVNAIEAEGYLRAMTTVLHYAESIKSSAKDSI